MPKIQFPPKKALDIEEIKAEVLRLQEEEKNLKANYGANAKIIELARDLENPKVDQLDFIIEQYENDWEFVQKLIKSFEAIGITEKVRENLEKHKNNPAFAKLGYAVNVEGRLNLDKLEPILNFSRANYDAMSLDNPLMLVGELRIHAERRANNMREMVISQIPIDRDLLDRMPDEEKLQSYKVVLYDALDKLKEDAKLMPHVDSVRNIIKLLETTYINLLELLNDQIMVYEQGWDSSIPIFMGFDATIERLKNGYTENNVVVKGIRQYQSDFEGWKHKAEMQDAQLKVNEDKTSIQNQTIANNEAKILQQNQKMQSNEAKLRQQQDEIEGKLHDEGEDEEEEK